MSYNHFLNHLKANFTAVRLDESLLYAHVREFQYHKNTQLLHPGDICKHFYFIENGLVRTYEIKDNREDTLNFYRKNAFFSSFNSFFRQVPGTEGMICENEVKGVKISYKDWILLRKLNPYFNDLSIKIFEQLIIGLSDELNDYRKSTADERYVLLSSSHPEVRTTSLQKNIASFLGVTSPHHSAIKKKELKKHLPPKSES